jgi:putative Holliday junction resolvase
MRLLGVDYGGTRVGLALGDTETGLAGPWKVLTRKDDSQLLQELVEIVRQEAIDLLVIGLPHPLADQQRDTDQTQRIREFIELVRTSGLSVVEENETWSSSLAAKQGMEAGLRGKRDELAAANILQGYLDRYGIGGSE